MPGKRKGKEKKLDQDNVGITWFLNAKNFVKTKKKKGYDNFVKWVNNHGLQPSGLPK